VIPTSPVPWQALIVPDVVQQHVEEAAILHAIRTALTGTQRVKLHQLRRFDDRLVAHLDGLALAGDQAWSFCDAALESASRGAVFTAAIRAIEERQPKRLDRLYALTEAVPRTRGGLTSAFGWVERDHLKGIVAGLLRAQDPFRRTLGIAACSMHRLDPGLVSARRVQDTHPSVCARALRTAGEIGCQEAVPACAAIVRDDDPECGFWAAWSLVLLGNRGTALEIVRGAGLNNGAHRLRAFRLSLQVTSANASHGVLQQLSRDPGQLRWLIQGSGIAGDPVYVPWLVKQMTDEKTARLSGEAFSLITGVDLGLTGLEGKKPENVESGPNDDPGDPNVEMDPDDGLPWPDVEKVQKWWGANGGRFTPGTRYFMGAPVTREHCIDVLRNGYQRQRILAAHYLCLLEPGTPLFNTSAPAWRQQRLLAKMG
jgi:uncharacterized protein (TIGR02270 family)